MCYDKRTFVRLSEVFLGGLRPPFGRTAKPQNFPCGLLSALPGPYIRTFINIPLYRVVR